MRRKSLWKNLMLATALTVVLGTAPVTAFAADVDSTVTEQTAPEVKAVTVDVTSSSTTFDGTQDIVITYTVNGVQDGFEPYQDIPWFDGKTGVKEEKVSSTVYKFTIPTTLQQYVIEQNGATDGQTFVFDSKYSTGAVDFPTVTLTYTTGDNGDNGNGETPLYDVMLYSYNNQEFVDLKELTSDWVEVESGETVQLPLKGYMPIELGNDWQGKELTARFHFEGKTLENDSESTVDVTQQGNKVTVKTGDTSDFSMYLLIAAVSLVIITIIGVRR